MKHITTAVIAATLFISGCATVLESGAAPDPIKLQIPSIGNPKTIGVGDTIYKYQYATADGMLSGQGWKKELVYLGMDGDKINVMYRDYNGNLRKPTSEIEAQHSLVIGETVSHNGAEFTVIAMDGDSLTYLMDSGFRGEVE